MYPTRFGMPVLTLPYQKISPDVRGTNPQRRLSSVLFPQPDGPTMLTISPCPSVRVKSAITSLAASVSSPKTFLRLDTTSGGFVTTRHRSAVSIDSRANTASPQ